MERSLIVQNINAYLAGEQLTYDELVPFLDEVIDEINSEMDTTFPVFSERTETNYDCFPNKYIRSVVILGAAYKFYITDEEGSISAQKYEQEYAKNLFRMVRDYSNSVPDDYKAEDQGFLPSDIQRGIEYSGYNDF